MAKLERVYNIPLRKEFQKVPEYKRAKKAARAVKEFLSKHMKAEQDNVKIGKFLNENLWKRGVRHPPHHVKVNAIKDDEGIVRSELFGKPVEQPKAAKKEKKEKGKIAEKLKDMVVDKPKAEKAEETKEEKKSETKESAIKKETKKPAKEEAKKEKPETKKQ